MKKYQPNVEETTYDLIRLPYKYHKFYEYATKVCEVIRSKIPKIRIEDEDGCFSLMQNNPFLNFEARFKNGIKVRHTLSSETMRVDMNDGSVYEIKILGDISYLGKFICSVVRKAFDKMNLCLEKDKENKVQ